ncbi:MAG: site-specific integrase [Acidobacteria bacterium]|nr:site-specific integrase [Acidobacteriota bacterium]
MSYVLDEQVVLSRVPEGPLAACLAQFAASVKQRGYTPRYLHRLVTLAADFSRWLKQRDIRIRRITADHPAQYLRWRHRRRRPRQDDAAALAHIIEFLRREGMLPAAKQASHELTPVQACVQMYAQYLREDRGLAEATVCIYAPSIDRFLAKQFGTGPVQLGRLQARHVVGFVQREAPRLQLKRAKLLTTALRSFFRYARYRDALRLDLAAVVPCVANWSRPAIPRGIAPDQVSRLLSHIDRGTAKGRRDYAILLLLARLGLRAGEVVLLELEDIDWDGGCLSVHGKGGRRNQLPLPEQVGEALAAYLQDGRPRSASRRVFLRARAPIGGFRGPAAVSTVVRHALRRAGIDAPTTGAHQFRHGLAAEMLRQGASLIQIGDLLGHQSPQTTMIYTKVDLEGLRPLALPWPGGAS